jgi:hypothetical protein
MYVRTGERLPQISMLDGQLAMALGKDALEQRIDQVVDPVRFRRKDHKKLLLTIALHPLPATSKSLEDFVVMNNALDIRHDILRGLEEIRDKFFQEDPDFKKQIASERKLQDEMIMTTGYSSIPKVKPFLLQALITPFVLPSGNERVVTNMALTLAPNFAKQLLPPKLVQQILRSEASQSHLASLLVYLHTIAEKYYSSGGDPAFDRQVHAQLEAIKQKRKMDEKREQAQK